MTSIYCLNVNGDIGYNLLSILLSRFKVKITYILFLPFVMPLLTVPKDDLLDSTTFKDIDELKDRVFEYMIYYNEIRPHQSLRGKNPLAFLKNLSTNY